MLTAIGFVVSAYEVTMALEHSVEQRSFRPITKKGVQIFSGWDGAKVGAPIGGMVGGLFGIETGPGAVVTSAIGGIVFGAAGYFGSGWVFDQGWPGE